MNKKFYLSKKFWAAVVTSGAAITCFATGNEALAKLVTFVGTTLILGIGLADLGKEKEK
jgi:hypothetical protein